MIKRIAKYQTGDGKEFNTEVEARQHEIEQDAYKELNVLLRSSLGTGRPDSVLRHILAEQQAVRAILVKFQQRQPKPQLAKAA